LKAVDPSPELHSPGVDLASLLKRNACRSPGACSAMKRRA
jgi:hypothetical protein